MERFNANASKVLGFATQNDWARTFVVVVLICYSGLLAPSLPRAVAECLVGNPFCKVLFMTLLIWSVTGRNGLAVPLLVAIAFLVTVMTLNRYQMNDLAVAAASAEVQAEQENGEQENGEQENGEQENGEQLAEQFEENGNSCSAVSNGCSVKTSGDQCGPQGLECEPNGFGGNELAEF